MTDPIRLSAHAMATRFELVLAGDDPVHLRASGEEAIAEIERLDARLSLYRPESEIVWINSRASHEPVKVEPRLFGLLRRAAELSEATEGAFDITVAPLVRAWGFAGGRPRVPSPSEIESARELVGMRHVLLDPHTLTVRFDHEGVELDLGAIGKGYAVECAVEILLEHGITSALVHGGTSSIHAIGAPPGHDAWRVAIRDLSPSPQPSPAGGEGAAVASVAERSGAAEAGPAGPETVDLRDSSLSVSAIHGKSFSDGSHEYGHVIDPRTGEPVSHTRLAAVTGPSATECDALSTALLVLGGGWAGELEARFPGHVALTPVG